jgi:hypothetical protein
VARLGDFSPNYEAIVYLLWPSEKIQMQPTVITFFFHGLSYVTILAINGLGYISGDFFTNSSGHPA